MNFYHYLTVGLTFLVIGFAAAIYIFYILKKHVPGKFWGALVIGCIGSFLGGITYRIIGDFLNELADINDVNVFAALFFAVFLIWIFSKLSSS